MLIKLSAFWIASSRTWISFSAVFSAFLEASSVADVTDQLLRGTTLEGLIETIAKKKSDEY